MHELSIASEIVRIAVASAEQARIHRVTVLVGDLAGVDRQAIQFCLEAVAQGTLAQGARFDLQAVPGRGLCRKCRVEVPLARLYDPCPNCGELDLEILSGRELSIRELEVE